MREQDKPIIGAPLGRLQIVLRGVVATKSYRRGTLVGWHNDDSPVIEYKDGTLEVVESLAQTDWNMIQGKYHD